MKICILALWVAILTNAQLLDVRNPRRSLESRGRPDKIDRGPSTEVDTIVFDGRNIGMSVYYGTVDYIWHDRDSKSIVTQLDLLSILVGDLENDSYYQTYFQFPSATKPGQYESFTCTARYTRNLDHSLSYDVRNYEGALDFSLDYGRHPGSWSFIYSGDLSSNQTKEYAGWQQSDNPEEDYRTHYDRKKFYGL